MIAGVILAGNHAWRNDPLTALGPPLLLPVAGTPLVRRVLRWFRAGDVTRIVLCVAGPRMAFEHELDDGAAEGVEVYYFEDRLPRGPAGCVRDAAEFVGADDALIVDGPVLPAVPAAKLVSCGLQQPGGVLLAGDRAGSVHGGAGPGGAYFLRSAALECVPAVGFQDFKESLLPRLHESRLGPAILPETRPGPRVTDLASYIAIQRWVLEHDGEVETGGGYRVQARCFVHHTALVSAGARLSGATMIGPRSIVGERAVMVDSVIGADVSIAAQAVVNQSVLWDAVRVTAPVVLDQCVVADGAQIHESLSRRVVTTPHDRPPGGDSRRHGAFVTPRHRGANLQQQTRSAALRNAGSGKNA